MQLKYELAHAVRVKSKHSDLNIRTMLMEERPSANIVDVADKEAFDLIVMGSRGSGVSRAGFSVAPAAGSSIPV